MAGTIKQTKQNETIKKKEKRKKKTQSGMKL